MIDLLDCAFLIHLDLSRENLGCMTFPRTSSKCRLLKTLASQRFEFPYFSLYLPKIHDIHRSPSEMSDPTMNIPSPYLAANDVRWLRLQHVCDTSRPSYLHNANPYTWNDCVETGPRILRSSRGQNTLILLFRYVSWKWLTAYWPSCRIIMQCGVRANENQRGILSSYDEHKYCYQFQRIMATNIQAYVWNVRSCNFHSIGCIYMPQSSSKFSFLQCLDDIKGFMHRCHGQSWNISFILTPICFEIAKLALKSKFYLDLF